MILECRHCGAELTIDGNLRTTTCVFCASPSVIERPEAEAGPRPTFTLGFVQPEQEVRTRVARWLRSQSIFCPGSLRNARVEDLKGVYVPTYLYSAVARSHFQAEIGENYTETQTYTTKDSQGKTVTRTRTVTKTEWRSLAGTRSANVTDVLVTASKGLSNAELSAIEPFDWRALRRYSPAMIAGWPTENPSLALDEGLALARREAETLTAHALVRFLPDDSRRLVGHDTSLEEEAADLVLVPVWLLNARHEEDKPPVRIVVNGQTGEIHGKPPLSALRIAAAVVTGLLLAAAAYLYIQSGAAP